MGKSDNRNMYLYKLKKNYIIALIPGMFYTYVIVAYLLGAKIGFNVPQNIANLGVVVLASVYGTAIRNNGNKALANPDKLSA